MQRIYAKEAKKAALKSKKRSLTEDKVDQPRKRIRTTASRTRNVGDSRASSMGSNTKIVQRLTRTISDI